MNNKKNFIFIFILVPTILCAQPYIFYGKYHEKADSSEPYSETLRYNLATNVTEINPEAWGTDVWPIWDPTQSYLIVYIDKNTPPLLFDLADTSRYYYLDDFMNTDIKEFLYSQEKGRLYFFMDDSLVALDLSGQIVSTVGISFYGGNNPFMYPKRNAFFSSDGSKIYFYCIDTLTRNDQVWTYSILNNEVIEKRNLSEIAYPNANGYRIFFGKNGIGLIESYLRETKTQIYEIYNYNLLTKSDSIHYKNWAQAFFMKEGKYLVVTTEKDTSHVSYLDGNIRIYDMQNQKLIKTLSFPAGGAIYLFDNYPENFYYVKDLETYPQIFNANIDSILAEVQGFNFNIKLLNSQGTLLTGGTLQYYEGSWKEGINNGDGTFLVNTTQPKVSLRMTYEGGSQTLSNVSLRDSVAIFRTVNAQVQLQNSAGTPIDTGRVQYYAGSWRDFGYTSEGTAAKELLPANYSFRMSYAYASNDKQQNIGTNPTIVFQTVNAAIELRNSAGNLIDQGTVQYYSGAWRNIGTTSNGVVNVELLPNNYSFRMSYAFASNDKQQNIGTNPTVVFQTVNAAIELRNSTGNLIDQGTVQYYSGAWRNIGTTSNGVVNIELLPNNYSFRMSYAYASNDKQQNIGTNPTVVFQTVNAAIELRNSADNLIDQGSVQYYSGAWRSIGTTSNGVVNVELLPNNYSFRMSYAFASNDKQQNIGTNPTVTFSTVLCTVRVTQQGQPVNNADIKYYSGAWRQFGLTSNGEVTKELLPANLTFRAAYSGTSQDKTQNITANNIVEFVLP